MSNEFYNFHSPKSHEIFLGTNLNEADTLGPDKVESYRSIAYKLSEIFGLYGFFFSQKPGFIDPKNWSKLMDQIVKVKDPVQKWDTIVKLSKFLQGKVASDQMKPTKRGEFGYRGQYDYGDETQNLPQATEFLRSASKAALQSFSPDEEAKAMEILDGILKETQPLVLTENLSYISEGQKYLPPSQQDLLRLSDSIGSKLLNIYNLLDNLKTAYPESSSEIDLFLNSKIIPNVEKVKKIINEDIPRVKGDATIGYMKKLEALDKTVAGYIPQSESLRNKIVKSFQPISASKEFEDSAQKIIDEVRKGILQQAENNARWKKTTDVVAGTTDIKDPKSSGTATPQTSSQSPESKRKKNVDDLADFLAKKYTFRK